LRVKEKWAIVGSLVLDRVMAAHLARTPSRLTRSSLAIPATTMRAASAWRWYRATPEEATALA
jgi:hypothetical protein